MCYEIKTEKVINLMNSCQFDPDCKMHISFLSCYISYFYVS